MIISIILLALASLLGSGVLFKHQRILTFLAAAGIVWQIFWIFLTMVDRILPGSTATTFLLGSIILLVAFIPFCKHWSAPAISHPSHLFRDLFILLPLVIVLIAAWLIASSNGFNQDGDWVTHGYYNGDTATMVALTNRSMLNDSFIQTNPFAGGGKLEYPTLFHTSLATLLSTLNLGLNWFRYLPFFTYIQILLTVPAFFLLWDVVFPLPKKDDNEWLGIGLVKNESKKRGNAAGDPRRAPAGPFWGRSRRAGVQRRPFDPELKVEGQAPLLISPSSITLALQSFIVVYVMAISWDSFVYPQTHFFLTGILLFLTALLLRLRQQKDWPQALSIVLAAATTLILILSNAVIGTIALALFITIALFQVFTSSPASIKIAFFILSVALLAIFFLLSPGNASFGLPWFSYTAAESLLRLSPIILALAFAIILGLEQDSFLPIVATLLLAMAFFTFFFSQRDIIIANSERFIYHSLLAAFPLLLLPLIRLWYWARRRLFFTTLNFPQLLATYGAAIAVTVIFIFPALISLARTHDHLMFQDQITVPVDTIKALNWIAKNTSPSSVILTSPDAPFIIPMFTGRAQLRVDYWLGVDDDILAEVQKAYLGDQASQSAVLDFADYMLIGIHEKNWNLKQYEPLFQNPTTAVIKL